MRHYLAVGILAAALAVGAPADSRHDDRVRCAKVKDKIRHLQSQMRAGYTRARGERLAKELRRLRKERRKVCR